MSASPATARHIDESASPLADCAQSRPCCRQQTMESKLKAYLWPAEGTRPPPMTRTRWRRFADRHLPSVVIYLMVATLVAVVLYPHMVITVPSGFIGVLWKRFSNGTVLDPRLLKNEGFNFVAPWNQVFLYDLRLQSFTESYNAISSDGVNLTASIVVRFRLQRDAVPVLHQAIGPNYQQVLIQPGIGSLTREVIAQYTAEQVYSTARQEIQDKIRDLVENRLSEKMMEHEGEESYRVSMRETIILGNVDSSAPPAGSAQPISNDKADKDRATAPGPAVPFEKMPAAGLSTPAEKMPPVTPGAAPAATPSPAPAAKAQETRSLWPITLSDIESYLARMLLPAAKTESKQPTAAAEQPR